MNDTPEQRVEDADDCPYCGGSEEVEARVADGHSDYIPCPHPVHRRAHQPQGDSVALREALFQSEQLLERIDRLKSINFREVRQQILTIRAALNASPATPAEPVTREAGSDWFSGEVDCDGNELVTIRADELQRLRDEREKFMWQVRDTCVRAEKAEALLTDRTEQVRAEERERCAQIAESDRDYPGASLRTRDRIAAALRTSASQEKSNGQ